LSQKTVCEKSALTQKHNALIHELSQVKGELKALTKLTQYQASLKPQQEKIKAREEQLLADIAVVKTKGSGATMKTRHKNTHCSSF
jgi:uncharacterized protein involved in exopolysaccharide biosynthesis